MFFIVRNNYQQETIIQSFRGIICMGCLPGHCYEYKITAKKKKSLKFQYAYYEKKMLLVKLHWTSILLMAVCCSFSAFSQDRITVSGTVLDSLDSGPLPGVSIMIDGTKEATQTNERGQYSINVPSNSILVFAYVGYTQKKISVNGQTIYQCTPCQF